MNMNMNINEIGAMISFIAGIVVIIGGFIFSKRSKSSEQVKRNVSMGAYLLGGVSSIINGIQLWGIMNGTFEPISDLPELPNLPATPTLPDTTTASAHIIELFGMSVNLFNLVNIGLGIVVMVIGLIFKQKKWSKVVILFGVMAVLTGLFQILL